MPAGTQHAPVLCCAAQEHAGWNNLKTLVGAWRVLRGYKPPKSVDAVADAPAAVPAATYQRTLGQYAERRL